jgi:photosystem II stability/assembly factor-like uncharacterized protein
LSVAIAVMFFATGVHADDAAADWELTGLTEPVLRLFTPTSGAFFAQTAQAFWRSDDAGLTWQQVPLGPASTILAVDPTNHSVLYAAGSAGVYQTRDDATTWQLIEPYSPEVGKQALALAVSPADPNLLYLGVAGNPGGSADFRFFRSRDAGVSWQLLEERHFTLCAWSVSILEPHPTDVQRFFRAAACTAGRNFGAALDQSTNQGDTWTPIFNSQTDLGYPRHLVGGQGADVARLYLAVNRDRRLGGSTLFRSDDDGATWTAVLAYRGGGSSGFAQAGDDPNAPNVWLGGLAYDPSNPDQVYVGRQSFPGYFDAADGGGAVASSDGGATWADLGRQDIGAVNDLAFGIDGLNLYAATDQGLWRLKLL